MQYLDSVLAVGGELEDGSMSASVHWLDPEALEWEELPFSLATARSDFAAVVMTEDYVACL